MTRVRNQNDGIYTGGNDSGLLTVTRLRHHDSSLAHGLLGTIALGVNPSAIPAPVGN